MNPECVICHENFQPTDVLYSTYCGHIFHFSCLSEWLQRSKTCPQCRQQTNDKRILRIWLNDGGNDTSLNSEDAALLKNILADYLRLREQLDDLNEELSSANLIRRDYKKKIEKLQAELKRYKDEKTTTFDYFKKYYSKSKIPNQKRNYEAAKHSKKLTITIKEVSEADENATVFSPKLKSHRPDKRRTNY